MGVIDSFFESTTVKIAASFISALLITYYSIPSIVSVARSRHLFDEPNGRTSHKNATPTLGGIAIFSAITIAMLVFFDFTSFPDMQYVIAGSIILFFIGIKDDILSISPMKKLSGQILASLLIIILGDIRFTDIHGFFGVHTIGYIPSIAITLFVLIVIINCFNLVDGIDGLSSGIAGVASTAFGVWFALNEEWEYAAISAALIGALLAFFYFNVWGVKNKIFMGDTGSLILGLILGMIVIHFNQMNAIRDLAYPVSGPPAVSFGILIIPLYDTLRVFINRALQKKSPFNPDKGHVHHKLLQLGNSHLQATLILMGVNILFIVIVFALHSMAMEPLFLILFVLATIFSFLPIYLLKKRLHSDAKKA